MKDFKLYSMVLALLVLGACFGGVKKTGKVVSYANGVVKTKKGFYEVGVLSEEWEREKVNSYSIIHFRNPSLKSSISTDAFCDDAYDDAPLPMLTMHLQSVVGPRQLVSEKEFMLDQRSAFRSIAQGKMDGVPVILDTVVVKKNKCLFDFLLVADPAFYPKAKGDFEKFFNGFRYTGEI